jgi:hypothetical protein
MFRGIENVSIPVTVTFWPLVFLFNVSLILVELSNYFIVTFHPHQSKYTISFVVMCDQIKVHKGCVSDS